VNVAEKDILKNRRF